MFVKIYVLSFFYITLFKYIQRHSLKTHILRAPKTQFKTPILHALSPQRWRGDRDDRDEEDEIRKIKFCPMTDGVKYKVASI